MIVTSQGNAETVDKRKIKMNVKIFKKTSILIKKNVQEATSTRKQA